MIMVSSLELLNLQCIAVKDSYACFMGKQEIGLRGVDTESTAVAPIA